MSLVLSIVLKATTMTSQRAYKIGVFDASLLEFLPEISSPAALGYCQS
jgi:hypothetical protein